MTLVLYRIVLHRVVSSDVISRKCFTKAFFFRLAIVGLCPLSTRDLEFASHGQQY